MTTIATMTPGTDDEKMMTEILNGVAGGSVGTNISDVNTTSLMVGAEGLENSNPRLINGVVVLLLMVFNLVGNSLVFYIYHYLFQRTVFCLFVKMLAGLDIMTALVTMLIDVMMKMRSNHETELHTSAMCKLSHFQVYANSLVSGCVLTLIAYQRYTKICHPLKQTMQLKRAKLILMITVCVCLVLSVPTLFLYGPRHIRVLVRSTVVLATICRADENVADTPLHLVFYYTLMTAFCLVLGATIVLYIMVSRAIRSFERRTSLFNPNSLSACSPATPTPPEDSLHYQHVIGKDGRPGNSSSPVNGRMMVITDPNHRPLSPLDTPETRNGLLEARRSIFSLSTMNSTNVISAQMFRVFSIITIVYIVSYLPHLLALILTKVLSLDQKVLTYVQRMMLEFAYNCPYIATVSNPLIYGFSSAEFRDKLKDFLRDWDYCCCFCSCCCEDGLQFISCCCCDDSDD